MSSDGHKRVGESTLGRIDELAEGWSAPVAEGVSSGPSASGVPEEVESALANGSGIMAAARNRRTSGPPPPPPGRSQRKSGPPPPPPGRKKPTTHPPLRADRPAMP